MASLLGLTSHIHVSAADMTYQEGGYGWISIHGRERFARYLHSAEVSGPLQQDIEEYHGCIPLLSCCRFFGLISLNSLTYYFYMRSSKPNIGKQTPLGGV